MLGQVNGTSDKQTVAKLRLNTVHPKQVEYEGKFKHL